MRVRWALVVAAVLSGVIVAVPGQAQVPGALSCAQLPGTFSDVWAPTFSSEEVPGSDLTVHASGRCVLNGTFVHATLDGTGRGLFAGLCGAAAWSSSMDPSGPQVRPDEEGTIDVTVQLQDASGAVTTLTDTWTVETENIEAVALWSDSAAGVIATRVFARCAPNAYTYWFQGGNDNARFTWEQAV